MYIHSDTPERVINSTALKEPNWVCLQDHAEFNLTWLHFHLMDMTEQGTFA